MRRMILGLALLGAAPALALAQLSPATPDRNPPAAAAENSTRPEAPRPVPESVPQREGTQHQAPGGRGVDGSGATSPNAPAERGNAAVRTDGGTPAAAMPAPGANSFTEGQARSRIEAAGFSDVTGLRRDEQGIWRGQAMRGGRQNSVALDFQGNVLVQ